jgi:glycosyltransferase involved in cell wall biosynthesis
MRLTILNQFFYPDHSATSQLMTDLAQNLCEHGVEVTALSSRGRYNGGDALPSRGYYRGVKIERAWATCFGKRNMTGRLCDYLTFYLGAFWKLLIMPRQHVVMALTTPPLIGLIALLVGRLRGMRFVALMEDLYPDVAIALGALSPNSLVARLFDRLTCLMLRKADRIIVLSDCMLDRVIAKIGPEAYSRIDVIHNWADGQEIAPQTKNGYLSRPDCPDVADKLVVLFSGNLGLVNEFATVLEAARRVRDRRDIAFVFIGEGAKADEIRGFVRRHHLDNIQMLPYQPREALPWCLASGDVLLITLAEGLAGLSVPSKTYSSLAAGRPLLYVGDQNSSVANLILQHHCGATVASGDNDRLAAILTGWADNRAPLADFGVASRALFEQCFNRPAAVHGYLESLRKCMHDPARATDAAFPDIVPIKSVGVNESVNIEIEECV